LTSVNCISHCPLCIWRRVCAKRHRVDRTGPAPHRYFLPYGAGLSLLIDTIMFTEEGRIMSTVPREIAIKY